MRAPSSRASAWRSSSRAAIAPRRRRAVARLKRETGNATSARWDSTSARSPPCARFAAEIEARDVPLHAIVCNAGLQTSGRARRSRRRLRAHLRGQPPRTLPAGESAAAPACGAARRRASWSSPRASTTRSSGPACRSPTSATSTCSPRPAARSRALRRAPRVRQQQALQPLVRLRADAPPRRVGPDREDASALGECLRSGARAGLRARPRISAGAPLGVDPRAAGGRAHRHALHRRPSIRADKAGDALARLVLDPSLERISGKYFPSHARWGEAPSSDASYDQSRAAALWDASVRMTRARAGRVAARRRLSRRTSRDRRATAR